MSVHFIERPDVYVTWLREPSQLLDECVAYYALILDLLTAPKVQFYYLLGAGDSIWGGGKTASPMVSVILTIMMTMLKIRLWKSY